MNRFFFFLLLNGTVLIVIQLKVDRSRFGICGSQFVPIPYLNTVAGKDVYALTNGILSMWLATVQIHSMHKSNEMKSHRHSCAMKRHLNLSLHV